MTTGQGQALWERKLNGAMRAEKGTFKLDEHSWEHFLEVTFKLYLV